MPGSKEVQPTNPDFPVRPRLPQDPPISQLPPPCVLLSRTRLPDAMQSWSGEMEPERAWEEYLRTIRALAASSICCHSEMAEIKIGSGAVGACKRKDVREWELRTHTSPPHATSGRPFSPQCPPRGILLFPFTKLGPCQGSGPCYLSKICGCSRRQSRVT